MKNIIIHEKYFGMFQHLNYSRSSDRANFCSKMKSYCVLCETSQFESSYVVTILVSTTMNPKTPYIHYKIKYIFETKKFKKSHCYEIALFDSVLFEDPLQVPALYPTSPKKSLLNRTTVHRLSLDYKRVVDGQEPKACDWRI